MIGKIISKEKWDNLMSFGDNIISKSADSMSNGQVLSLTIPVYFTAGLDVPYEISLVSTALSGKSFRIEFAGVVGVVTNNTLALTCNGITKSIVFDYYHNSTASIVFRIYPNRKQEYSRLICIANDVSLELDKFFKNPSGSVTQIKFTTNGNYKDCVLNTRFWMSDLAIFGNFTKSCNFGPIASRDMYIGAEKATSTEVLSAFKAFIECWTPKVAVWAAGMYESDVNTAINSKWLANLTEFLTICEDKGILPVVCTLPNIGTHNHRAKNAHIRTLSVHINDMALLINRELDGEYFPMRSWDATLDAPTPHGYWIFAYVLKGHFPYIS